MFAARVAIASLLKRYMRAERAYLVTYLAFLLFLVLGFMVVGMTGMPMYGFDQQNWAHWFAYMTLIFSPLGLPVLLGTPIVFIADLLRRPWRARSLDRT
jgi:hypothetical protein